MISASRVTSIYEALKGETIFVTRPHVEKVCGESSSAKQALKKLRAEYSGLEGALNESEGLNIKEEKSLAMSSRSYFEAGQRLALH